MHGAQIMQLIVKNVAHEQRLLKRTWNRKEEEIRTVRRNLSILRASQNQLIRIELTTIEPQIIEDGFEQLEEQLQARIDTDTITDEVRHVVAKVITLGQTPAPARSH